jgi:hypothetical protein
VTTRQFFVAANAPQYLPNVFQVWPAITDPKPWLQHVLPAPTN